MEFMQHFLPGQAIETNGHSSLGLQSAWFFDHWTIGADIEFTDGFLEETQPNPTDSPVGFLVATIPAGDHYDYDVDARTLAAFAQYTNDITDVTRITFGARFEQVKYDYSNNMLTGRTDELSPEPS